MIFQKKILVWNKKRKRYLVFPKWRSNKRKVIFQQLFLTFICFDVIWVFVTVLASFFAFVYISQQLLNCHGNYHSSLPKINFRIINLLSISPDNFFGNHFLNWNFNSCFDIICYFVVHSLPNTSAYLFLSEFFLRRLKNKCVWHINWRRVLSIHWQFTKLLYLMFLRVLSIDNVSLGCYVKLFTL